MKRVVLLVLTAILGLSGEFVSAQIISYQDSTSFDDDFGRLREIDFEDMYGVTVDRMKIRNPYALQSLAIPDLQGTPTSDVILLLAQGATIDFPTRTRSIELVGYGSPFYVHVTTFADSTYVLDLRTFPTTINEDSGIARIQFFGTDGIGVDVNWGAGLYSITARDGSGDTLCFSNFDELEGDRYYFMGQAMDVAWIGDTSFIEPVEIHGITFNEPNYGFIGVHFADFEARPDADNPIGNLGVLFIAGGTIDFPDGTEGVLLTLEQLHPADSLLFEAIDNDGVRDTLLVVGAGREYDTNWVPEQRATFAHVAFGSEAGIKQIRMLSGWTTEAVDLIDTVINGENVQWVVYEQVGIETYVMAVHIAETPPTEISGIGGQVEQVENAGYLAVNETESLTAKLQDARQFAEAGDNQRAIERLQEFSQEVEALYVAGAFVIEESRGMRGDAAYVIDRLQQGVSGIPISSRNVQTLLPQLSNLRVDQSGLSASYYLPLAEGGVLVISDIRGSVVHRITLEKSGERGDLFWNLQDGEGNLLPAGTYFLSLSGGGVQTTSVIQVGR
ncbi:MAG: hypothetical protein AB7H80_09220 [Candidatus Kapaibacterium sp.]